MSVPHRSSPWMVITATALLLFGIVIFAEQQGVAQASPSLSAASSFYQNPVSAPNDTTTPTDTPLSDGPSSTPTPTQTPSGPTDTPTITGTPPTATATPTDCPNPFVDITGNVFYGAIHYLNCRGIINGTDATHYSPAGTSTRGQFAKVIVLGFAIPLYTPTSPDFTDVPANYFAYIYIEAGFHQGILSGFDAATCESIGAVFPCYIPNRAITRGQLTKLVVSAAGYPLTTPTGGPTFSDVPPTNVFYTTIETAYAKGIVSGYPGRTLTFRPNNNIRRDEMAQIVYKGITTP
jgi:S-layer family protein